MMRRVLQGSRTFGLVGVDTERQPREVGVTLSITHSQVLPDGRSIIVATATRRFNVKDQWELVRI